MKNCLFLFLLFPLLSLTPGEEEKLLNEKVPTFEGKTLSGMEVNSEYFEGKVTVLNFMFIGCPPCMYEVRSLNKLHEEYKDKPFQILSVAANTSAQLEQFRSDEKSSYSKIRKNFGAPVPSYELLAACETKKKRLPIFGGAECDNISNKFEVDGYPYTFLIDKSGVIRYVFPGFPVGNSAAFEKSLQIEIDKLLATE